MTSLASSSQFDLRRFSAGVGLVASLLGVGVGVHLTLLKFKMVYTPCLSPTGGCQVGGLSCGAALESTMSTLFGLPISLWGSAFYLATAALTASLLVCRESFGGTAAHILLLFACLGVAISGALAAYTAFVLPSPCPFCLALYAISALLLWTAWTVRQPRDTHALRYRELLRDRPADAVHCAFVALLVFVCGAGIQSLAYHGMRHQVDAQVGCPKPKDPLPDATIKFGARNPAAIIAVFLDMSCPACRREFRMLAKTVSGQKFPVPVQLWIYHTPRQTCDLDAFPGGYRKADPEARNADACLAARAVECMEKLSAGQGFWLIGGLFALQEKIDPNTPLFTPERIADRAADRGLEIDPDDPRNVLYDCIDTDATVLNRITTHQRFAEDEKFKVPTVAVYRAIDGAPDLERRPLFADADTPIEVLSTYAAQQAAVEVVK
ncbi:MAG: hypothetical protein H0T76_16550 [Nannocystis sp.]|nr:vitamin K epoxide reductase family protein [Nannocystis sp.]MBA3548093.1 hypothetical protein [Nannocystis sp.]